MISSSPIKYLFFRDVFKLFKEPYQVHPIRFRVDLGVISTP